MKEELFELLLRLADDQLVLGHRVSEWCGHAPTLDHHLFELLEIHRLIAIAHGVLWVGMNFYNDTVSAGGNSCSGYGRHQVGVSGTMAGVDDDRQVSLVLKVWHCRNWQGEAGMRFEGPNAAFAQHDIWITFIQNVLGCEQQLFHRCAGTTFEQNRAWRLTNGFEQSVVLHVSRAYL